jgi:hypothetical protein
MSRSYKQIALVLGGLLVGFAAMNAIFISIAFRQSDAVDAEKAGQFGDFVGGYVGTFFMLVSAVLLYLTLQNQQGANEREGFDERYFEMLKMHRDNVSEAELKENQGRRLFVLYFRELRAIISQVREVASQEQRELKQKDVMILAYHCLYYGVGPNSSRLLELSLPNYPRELVIAIDRRLNDPKLKADIARDRNLNYVPFEGHQSRLGHYFRHLYQTVKYVHLTKLDIDKKDYAKTIRAQLSTHEQALLLINSLTALGANWWKEKLITEYKMVRNLPKGFIDNDSELNVEDMFKDIPGYFEWQEHHK